MRETAHEITYAPHFLPHLSPQVPAQHHLAPEEMAEQQPTGTLCQPTSGLLALGMGHMVCHTEVSTRGSSAWVKDW